jgi:hypothetical protein
MDRNFEEYAKSLMARDPLAGSRALQRMRLDAQVETLYEAVCIKPNGDVRWRARGHNRVTTVGLNKLLDSTFGAGNAAPAWYVGLATSSIADASITSGQQAITSPSTPWQAGETGRAFILRGGGVAGADLIGTMTYVGAGQVTSSVAAGATISGNGIMLWECRAADIMSSHAPWSTSTAFSEAARPAWTPNGVAAGGSMSNSNAPAQFTINADSTIIGGAFLVDSSTKGGTTGTLYGMAPWSNSGFRQAYSNDIVQVTATLTLTAP